AVLTSQGFYTVPKYLYGRLSVQSLLLSSFDFFDCAFDIIFAKVCYMPLIAMFHEGYAFACNRIADDCSRYIGVCRWKVVECIDECFNIMTIDLYHIPAEALPLILDRFDAHQFVCMSIHGHFVVVDDCHKVAEFEVGSTHCRLPHLA